MQLKRTLNLTLVTFYGLGTIIGAGIYALIGEVSKEANQFTPFSFLIASLVALITASSYAELSARFPESAGSALYVKKAFNKIWLSGLTGWLVVLTGLVSSATLAHGFVNYLNLFYPLSEHIAIVIIVLILGCVAIWGITESAITIFFMTLIEITGLLIIVWYGKDNFANIISQADKYIPTASVNIWSGILTGAFIAFYAFIGFEDIVNIAEETKNPEKTLPRGIFLALLGATILYFLVSVTLLSLPQKQLTGLDMPLVAIIKHQGHSPLLFAIIAMIAITNGILVQMLMASRLMYGMARHKSAPKFLGHIFEKTQVPLNATLVNMLAIIILGYWFPINTLAKATSSIMLLVFSIIHLSLVIVKLKDSGKKDHFTIPIIFPIFGVILSLAFLSSQFFFRN